MHRRDVLRLAGHALLLSAVRPRAASATTASAAAPRLYFEPSEAEQIRAAAWSPLLEPATRAWLARAPRDIDRAWAKQARTGDILRDFSGAMGAMTDVAVAHLIEPTPARRDALLRGIERVLEVPKWDYFLDADDHVIGIMRASMANARLLFVRDVLGDDLPARLERALLRGIADKGCVPCSQTIEDMDAPDQPAGWRFDDQHQSTYDIDMRRWPEILGANNLRAIPTMGLGLGALALRGHDARADAWLAQATQSAQTFLGFFSEDGSYFEGLSYVDYALRTLLGFLDAHQRLVGDVDWLDAFNADGVLDFIVAMQAGRTDDGAPDIVNFSDARNSVFPCVPAWLGQATGSPLGAWAAEHVSRPGYHLDVLWYRPGRPSAPPPERLKNYRTALDWIVTRSGWAPDDAVLAFRSGGPTNHEHADRNSFLFKIHGERLLTDPFDASYDWREPGWPLRLTRAHNAVLIDGQGHQYHKGEEGVNASQAAARVVHYEPDGDRIWWTSDATQAYQLVLPHVTRVTRTMGFAKPNVLVLLDRIETDGEDAELTVRFVPDNRDRQATLATAPGAFTITRPRARLHARAFGSSSLRTQVGRLDVPPALGAHPHVDVVAAPGRTVEVVTLIAAQPTGNTTTPAMHAEATEDGWRFEVAGVRGRLATRGDAPVLHWS